MIIYNNNYLVIGTEISNNIISLINYTTNGFIKIFKLIIQSNTIEPNLICNQI